MSVNGLRVLVLAPIVMLVLLSVGSGASGALGPSTFPYRLGQVAGVTYGRLSLDGIVDPRSLLPAADSSTAGTPIAVPLRLTRQTANQDTAPVGGAATELPPAGEFAGSDDQRPRLTSSLTPSFLTSFAGLSSADNPSPLVPPDPQLAAGPSHLVEMVNIVGKIYDKNGTALSTTFTLGSFSESRLATSRPIQR